MREVIHRVRKAYIDKLNGSPNVTTLSEFRKRVEEDGGTLEAVVCILNVISDLQINSPIELRGVTIPVYNRVPSDASFPYIRIYSVSNDETDQNQTNYITEVITRLEVVTRFTGDSGGELDSNLITDEILQLVRTRSANYIDLDDEGFNVYTSQIESINYLEEDANDYTYFRVIIEVSNRIEQRTPQGGLQVELQTELQS